MRLRTLILYLLIAVLVLTPRASSAEMISPDDPGILYTGRVDFSDPLAPKLSWPGASIIANFEGTSLKANFDDDNGNNRIYVLIDSEDPVTVRLTAQAAQITLASGLADTVHRVEIVKKTEGCCGAGDFTFQGFELDAGKNLAAPPTRPLLKLEFYGDSHPAGYSCECTCDNGNPQYKNAYNAYPATTSRLLGAEYHSMSWSGLGIVPRIGQLGLTDVWERVLQGSAVPTWSFDDFQPDAVIINIGANDYYAGESQQDIMQAWESFVTDSLRPVYPKAHIVLVNSRGWAFGEPADYVHLSVANLHAAGDTNVSTTLFPWLWGQQHAVTCEHAGCANILADHLASVLGFPAPTPTATSCLGPTGRIANGNFENVYNGEATIADGWRTFSTGSGAALLTFDPAGAHSGNRYNQASVDASGTAGFAQSTAAEPGATFTVSAYMRTAAGNGGNLSLQFKDQGQNIIHQEAGEKTLTGSWTQYSTTATAPPNTWQVAVVCSVDTPFSTVHFDQVVLTEEGADLIFEDGFESGTLFAWSTTVDG